MSKSPDLAFGVAFALTLTGAAAAQGTPERLSAAPAGNAAPSGAGMVLGLGRAALPEEVAAWDIDVRPDGLGLPEGQGSVEDGEVLFSDNCASCHGEFGEGVDRWPVLAGGIGTLADEDPDKTLGSFWPYLSTGFDYIHRGMPFGNAQSLKSDEVYAVLAYILNMNDIVDDDFVLSRDNFLSVEMPNAGGFIMDDRDEVELPEFTQAPCMEGCRETPPEITRHASILDVTPETPDDAEAPPPMQ